MKKLLFTAYSMDVGGIETALVTLLNKLIENYEITLVLEKKQGVFLTSLNSNIKIIEYNPCDSKNQLYRKSVNLFKRLKFIFKYKNKFDFSASYATYSKMGSFCARTASKNNALWVHSNYFEFYNSNISEMIKFFNSIKYKNFKNIIFVSKNSMEAFSCVFKNVTNNLVLIHNFINADNIINKSNEKIELKNSNTVTFLNVARHDEKSKKISRLINVAQKLKNDNFNFKILMIGNGPDTELYKKNVHENALDNYILFLGEINNPYPYFKISDAIILTSDFEGYPVVFDEARVLKLPIITTDISDSKSDIDGKFGIVTSKEVNDIYEAIKNFILKKFEIKNTFDSETYNNEILKQLEKII